AQRPFALQHRQARRGLVELALALLQFAGDLADGQLLLGQAFAAVLVALVELAADGVQLGADALQLLGLLAGRGAGGLDVGGGAGRTVGTSSTAPTWTLSPEAR